MQKYNIYDAINSFNIPGIKDKSLEYLEKLGIKKPFDILYLFPKNYENRACINKIIDLEPDENATIYGRVVSVKVIKSPGKQSFIRIFLSDHTGMIELIFFKSSYLKNIIRVNTDIYVTGRVVGPKIKMVNPDYSFKNIEGILPIYPLTKGLSQSRRRIIMHSFLKYFNNLDEILPSDLVTKYIILDRNIALKEIHFPTDQKMLEQAKRRFAIEELFIFQLAVLQRKFISNNRIDNLKLDNLEVVKQYVKNLPFKLTGAQKRVITEIYNELIGPNEVNRLIQGDVGSGKSVVAFILMLYIASNNYQVVLMAPTAVLAEQHYKSIKDDFEKLGIRIAFLSGNTKAKDKKNILSKLLSGEIDILIGTHALIYDSVAFKNLGLIIVDEQHKFGVLQRKLLKDKSIFSNFIAMSATPIPRSLALTIYGDLDISVIDELPAGRKKILTKVVSLEYLDRLFEIIKPRIESGEQCYIVCPLIEDSDKINAASSISIFEKIKNSTLGSFSIGLLHGKLKSNEKDEVIEKFKENSIQILVSTTVIEVGINVPNATVMVILNADRFGLSQLHQIRGRVGRGNISSTCYLVSEFSYNCKRLNILEKSENGFDIAEADLQHRESGDLLGIKQSGTNNFLSFDSLKDIKTIQAIKLEVLNYLKRNNGILDKRLVFEFENRFLNKSTMD
jgi:ATP-dependent DNA helicase RecG